MKLALLSSCGSPIPKEEQVVLRAKRRQNLGEKRGMAARGKLA